MTTFTDGGGARKGQPVTIINIRVTFEITLMNKVVIGG